MRTAAGIAAGAALAALGLSAATARADAPEVAPPIPWQEPAPVSRLFLQLPLDAPEALAAHAGSAEVRLLYSNSVLGADAGPYHLDVHVETAQTTVLLRQGLGGGAEAQFAIPVYGESGGFLDPAIVAVDRAFRTQNWLRVWKPRGEARFQLTRDGAGIAADSPGGLGDAWLGLKLQVLEASGAVPALALRPALKLATGALPLGSGAPDAGASLLAAWVLAPWAVRVQVDAIAPFGGLGALGIRPRPYGAAQVAASLGLGRSAALHLQLSGHLSPISGTGLTPIQAPTFYALAGVTAELARGFALEGAVVENVFSPQRGADISFVLGVRSSL